MVGERFDSKNMIIGTPKEHDLEIPFLFVDESAAGGDTQAQALLSPARASARAAGFDLKAANGEPITIESGRWALIPSGIAIGIPEGFEGQVRPRSGLAMRHGVTVLNAPGTIDSDYRGEIKILLINHGDAPFVVERGMRVAQLVMAPMAPVELQVSITLSTTARGENGFGSTGLGML